jgi:hypothetical protein
VAPDEAVATPEESPVVASQRPADVSPLAAVIGIALLGGMLLIGVLIGRSGSDDTTTPAPVVQVTGQTTTPTGSTTTTAPADPAQPSGAITTDWPTDARGFTVQLSLVAKDGATQDTVDAAKQSATASGAKQVGSLDSDLYPSLDPGSYVIYSGIYTDRQQATQALSKLGKSFPDATVVEVSSAVKGQGTAPELSPSGGSE